MVHPNHVLLNNRTLVEVFGDKVGGRTDQLHTPLMEYIGGQTGIEDAGLLALLERGLPIVGEALKSPFFWDQPTTAELTLEQLLATAKQRRDRIMAAMIPAPSQRRSGRALERRRNGAGTPLERGPDSDWSRACALI